MGGWRSYAAPVVSLQCCSQPRQRWPGAFHSYLIASILAVFHGFYYEQQLLKVPDSMHTNACIYSIQMLTE